MVIYQVLQNGIMSKSKYFDIILDGTYKFQIEVTDFQTLFKMEIDQFVKAHYNFNGEVVCEQTECRLIERRRLSYYKEM